MHLFDLFSGLLCQLHTHTHTHTGTYVLIDNSDRRGFCLFPVLGNSQQLHFMRTELDTQVRHANIFALELPRIVKQPKGQLGARAGRGAQRGESEGSNCSSLYANFYAYSICMSCMQKKGKNKTRKYKKKLLGGKWEGGRRGRALYENCTPNFGRVDVAINLCADECSSKLQMYLCVVCGVCGVWVCA